MPILITHFIAKHIKHTHFIYKENEQFFNKKYEHSLLKVHANEKYFLFKL